MLSCCRGTLILPNIQQAVYHTHISFHSGSALAQPWAQAGRSDIVIALEAPDPVGEQARKQAASYTGRERLAVLEVVGEKSRRKSEEGLESLGNEKIADTHGRSRHCAAWGAIIREAEVGKDWGRILLGRCPGSTKLEVGKAAWIGCYETQGVRCLGCFLQGVARYFTFIYL